MPKAPWWAYVCMYMLDQLAKPTFRSRYAHTPFGHGTEWRTGGHSRICVCSNIFSETTGPTEAKFHVEPPWDRGRKFIQMVQAICCSSWLSTSGGAGAFSRDFTINLSPQCRAFSRALKTEKIKAPLFPGPVGAGTTYDWCSNSFELKNYTWPRFCMIQGTVNLEFVLWQMKCSMSGPATPFKCHYNLALISLWAKNDPAPHLWGILQT